MDRIIARTFALASASLTKRILKGIGLKPALREKLLPPPHLPRVLVLGRKIEPRMNTDYKRLVIIERAALLIRSLQPAG
jgi:hypothetical protein